MALPRQCVRQEGLHDTQLNTDMYVCMCIYTYMTVSTLVCLRKGINNMRVKE